jgi:cytochrome P450
MPPTVTERRSFAALPPIARGAPLVGMLPRLFRDPVRCCADVARSHGDIARLGLGLTDVLMVTHPDHVKYVLQEASANFGKGKSWEAMRAAIGNSLPTSDGAYWLRQRRMIQPAFHRERVARLASLVADVVDARVASWDEAARTGEPVDVYLEMKRLTRDVVLAAMFGTSLRPEEAAAMDPAVPIMMDGIGLLMWSSFLPDFLPVPGKQRVRRAVETIDAIVFRIIDERRASGKEGDDLLALLLAARDEEGGGALTRAQLRDEVIGMLVASYEATALALTWTFYALTQHPSAARRLAAEVDQALAGRKPSAEDLPRLGYARMVFEESMRVYPPGWVIPRQAIAEDTIGGYRVPAGAIVLVCNFLTHRHPAFWERPDVFDPERFAPDRASARPRYAFLPFGGGPRQCIGNAFAMIEAQLVLASVAQRYTLAPAEAVRARPSHVMLKPDPTLKLCLRRRAPV